MVLIARHSPNFIINNSFLGSDFLGFISSNTNRCKLSLKSRVFSHRNIEHNTSETMQYNIVRGTIDFQCLVETLSVRLDAIVLMISISWKHNILVLHAFSTSNIQVKQQCLLWNTRDFKFIWQQLFHLTVIFSIFLLSSYSSWWWLKIKSY